MAETREEIEKSDREYHAKIRYHHKGGRCKLSFHENRLIVEFEEAQRAPAPGQTLVVYSVDGNIVCGGRILMKDYEVRNGN